MPLDPDDLYAALLDAGIEEFAGVHDPPDSPRARRDEAIYARDGWRCAAPGCTSRRNLEDHHVIYRSRGGDDGHDNRLCLYRFHHQWGEHGGLASCRGKAPLDITWLLGRDGIGGRFRNERLLGTSEALRPTMALQS